MDLEVVLPDDGHDEPARTVDEVHSVAVWFGPADGASDRMAEFAAAFRG